MSGVTDKTLRSIFERFTVADAADAGGASPVLTKPAFAHFVEAVPQLLTSVFTLDVALDVFTGVADPDTQTVSFPAFSSLLTAVSIVRYADEGE